jgi:UDPglucose 6-dehydrogenase
MKIGIIGFGVVGGTLGKWLKEHTTHELRIYDPDKGLRDSLDGCEAIFISVPVPANESGQDTAILKQSVALAKKYTNNVFIRSTVLPGTNDELGTISMPEFLTERRAYQDMCKYPILTGQCDKELLERIFPNKQIIQVENTEAELSKYAHNCFGAVKVLYFNIINNLCDYMSARYDKVLQGSMITGFIERTHTIIAQDGLKGYGGKCFGPNIESLKNFLYKEGKEIEADLFQQVHDINEKYRNDSEVIYGVEA